MPRHSVKTEAPAQYLAAVKTDRAEDDAIIFRAMQILMERARVVEFTITSPEATRDYLKLALTEKQWEVFGVVFLDNRHRVIAYEELFRGTIDGASVHPREVVRSAIAHNAAAVILAHNHPSGVNQPSPADQRITARLKEALALIDVRVLDHMIVGGPDTQPYSFAENGVL
jgi:DNA repair protein RadC